MSYCDLCQIYTYTKYRNLLAITENDLNICTFDDSTLLQQTKLMIAITFSQSLCPVMQDSFWIYSPIIHEQIMNHLMTRHMKIIYS